MKNKYTKEFEDFVRQNISKYKKEDFILLLEKKYKIKMSKDALKSYIRRHNVKDRYIDYKEYMVRGTAKHKIGAERMTKDGIIVKVAQPNVWRRKSRVMYEKYHNCKLTDDDYILFLNGNRNDFSKENLFKSTNQEKCYLHNWGTSSKNKELTKTGILSARLYIKAKEKEIANENK
jgi:hypothetical protein